nr:immunoglobulin light chain junction region [Macaca mulatta]
CQHYYTSPYSV